MFGAVAEQPADPIQRVIGVAAVAQGVLLDPAADLVDDLGAELDDVEGVQDGDRVGQLVADRVVESDRGAVSRLSTGPFPRSAPRTGRATSTASGSPRVGARGQATRVVALCGVQGVGIAAPR